MKQIALEVSFFQLIKSTIECDKLHYKCRDTIVHQARAAIKH